MGLIIQKKKSVAQIEAGTYIAKCVGIVDVGEQYSEKFKKYSSKVLLIFELPFEVVEVDGQLKPRWISETYNASLNEKGNLSKVLTSWRGKPLTEDEEQNFDLTSMAGKSCILNIIVEEKESGSFNKIVSISPLMKGTPEPVLKNDILIFDMDNWSQETFEKLPEWIQERIKQSTEYQKKYATVQKIDFPAETAVETVTQTAVEQQTEVATEPKAEAVGKVAPF